MNKVHTSYEGNSIFVGIDVHKKNWSVAIYSEKTFHKRFSQPAEAEILKQYLERYFPGASFKSVYEAGFSGFTAHRELTTRGIENIVVNPSDIPTMDKERKTKSDLVDCQKLALCLRAGQLRANYIPSQQEEQHRQLIRGRYYARRDLTRKQNRVRSLINRFGFKELQSGRWSQKFIAKLQAYVIEDEIFKKVWQMYIDDVIVQMALLQSYNKQLKQLSSSIRYNKNYELLRSVPGVGPLVAMTLLLELMDISRFKSLDELCSYVGLIPNVFGSGDKQHVGRITKRGNSYVKNMIIESAWKAKSEDPTLLIKYEQLAQRMNGNKAIVRIAKSLLRRIRAVLKSQQRYKIQHTPKTNFNKNEKLSAQEE